MLLTASLCFASTALIFMLRQRMGQSDSAPQTAATASPLKKFTKADLAKPSGADSLLVAINGKVYDVGRFKSHPGGTEPFVRAVLFSSRRTAVLALLLQLEVAGKDGTKEWQAAMHSPAAIEQMSEYLVGELVADSTAASTATSAPVAVAAATPATAEQSNNSSNASSADKKAAATAPAAAAAPASKSSGAELPQLTVLFGSQTGAAKGEQTATLRHKYLEFIQFTLRNRFRQPNRSDLPTPGELFRVAALCLCAHAARWICSRVACACNRWATPIL